MVDIEFSGQNFNRFEREIRQALQRRLAQELERATNRVLEREIAEIARAIEASPEFQALGGRLQGEFGFTDAEVAALPQIFSLLIPGTPGSVVEIVSQGTGSSQQTTARLDLDRLKAHPLAQHDLTNTRGPGQTISWVEWLEEGVTIFGYVFDDRLEFTRRTPPSRSGEGLMIPTAGGIWVSEPTFIFERSFDRLNQNEVEQQIRREVIRRLRSRRVQ